MANVPQQRQRDGEQDPLLDSEDRHRRGRHHREGEFAGTLRDNVAQRRDVDEPDGDREDDPGEHATREVLERRRHEQQDRDDDGCGRELGDLRRRAGAIAHRCLRRAAVDDERTAHRGRGVRRRQSENVRVLVEALAMALREYPRRRGALRDDDREARGRDRQQRAQLVHRRHRKPQCGEPSGHRTDHIDAAAREVVRAARCDPRDDSDERHRQARQRLPTSENRRDHERRYGNRRTMDLGETADELAQLIDGAMRRHGDAEHLAEHGDADLDADAGEESDEHGPRQEIGEESELEEPREQKQRGGEQRERADERHVPLAARRGHFGKPAGEDRRGRRVGRHDQVPRRSEDRERHRRQHQRVKAGDDRRTGDPRVAQHLRNVHRREHHACDGVAERSPELPGSACRRRASAHGAYARSS